MPDARMPPLPPAGLDIAEALAALPQETPDRSAWPLLAERIAAAERARKPRPRWPFALAAAAVLAVVALMPRLQPAPTPAAAPTIAAGATAPATAADTPSLDDLMAESARLEHLLGAVGDQQSTSASATALTLEFEDQLQRIDRTLSDPGLDAETRTALWSHRVALLRDFAGIQGTTQWLAAEGDSHDGELVAVF